MLHILVAFLVSASHSQVRSRSESSNKIIKEVYAIKEVTQLQISDITDGRSIVLNITNSWGPFQVFAFFYIPDQTISSFLIDGAQVSFTQRQPNYEMFSIYGNTIEFQFASKSGGSSKGSAEFWILKTETCNEFSVAEFGGLTKEINVKFPSNILQLNQGHYYFCIFSPHLNGISATSSLNFGSTSSTAINMAYLYSPNKTISDTMIFDYDPSFSFPTSQASFIQHTFSGTSSTVVEDAKAIFVRNVTSTSDEAFHTNNCVAMNCLNCSGRSCANSLANNISFTCPGQTPTVAPITSNLPTYTSSSLPTYTSSSMPTNTGSSSNSSNTGRTVGIVIGVIVAIAAVAIIVILAIRHFKNSKRHDSFFESTSQINSKLINNEPLLLSQDNSKSNSHSYNQTPENQSTTASTTGYSNSLVLKAPPQAPITETNSPIDNQLDTAASPPSNVQHFSGGIDEQSTPDGMG